MNRYSNVVLVGALANLLLLMLFPPFDVVSLSERGIRYFDAFYPMFAVPPNRTINADLLFSPCMAWSATRLPRSSCCRASGRLLRA